MVSIDSAGRSVCFDAWQLGDRLLQAAIAVRSVVFGVRGVGGWSVASQPMGSFQEFLRAYQASFDTHSGDWVSPAVASKAVGISARRLVQMHDEGKLDPNCAKQTNESEERRRFVFNIKMLQESIGSTG